MDAWKLVRQFEHGLSYHAGVLYDNRAITIGGVSDGVTIPWVLQSPDGIHGDYIANAPVGLSARQRHAACVFDGKMWVSGGYEGGAAHNDLLCSGDGKKWETMYEHTEGVLNHRMVAFGNPKIELVVLGGYDLTNFNNGIERSSNGKDWTIVDVQGEHWTERSGFGAMVYKNKLWVFGGINGTGALDDIWYTDNLKDWHLVDSHAPWGTICDFGFCEWDERMWIIGGYGYDYDGRTQGWVVTPKREVWFSRDGCHWDQAFDFPTTVYHTWAESINNRLHVFGGVGNETNVYQMILG